MVVNLCLPSVAGGLRREPGDDSERDSWDGYQHLERLLRDHKHTGESGKSVDQDLSYSSSLSESDSEQATLTSNGTDDRRATSHVNDFSGSIDDSSHANTK